MYLRLLLLISLSAPLMAQSISPSQIKTLATCGDSTHALAVKLNVNPPTFYCQAITTGSSGTVTSIATTSPILGGTITTTGTISCQTADTSHAGCLTSTDWNIFNGKGSGTVTSVATGTGLTGGPITTTGTISLITPVASGNGGTGVSNTATLTLGTSNHNYATLGTGIIKNTTTTGALSNAAVGDITTLFSSCSGTQYLGFDGNCHTAGVGSVTSVDHSFTGGLITASGGPITTSGTLALTVAGTSGGIPYFSGASTWASSAALGANLPVFGGGAGTAPIVGTRSGNTTEVGTVTGSLTSGNCAKWDASGNIIDAGAPCIGSGGGGIPSCGSPSGINGWDVIPCSAGSFDDEFEGSVSGSWTQVNFGTSSATAINGSLVFIPQDTNNAFSFRQLEQPVPVSTPWTITAKMTLVDTASTGLSHRRVGIYVSDGTKLDVLWIHQNNSNPPVLSIDTDQEANNTSGPNNTASLTIAGITTNGFLASDYGWAKYFRLQNDGTNLNFYWSNDNQTYVLIHTELKGSFLGTITKLGIAVDASQLTAKIVGRFEWFRRTQ